MKRQQLTIWVSAILAVLFLFVVLVFQVRQTEIAVVTTFGQITRPINEPGGYFRWPWPIQKIYKFDRRLQNFESRFDQVTTADGRSLTVSIFAGWRIQKPQLFQERFKGSFTRAQDNIEDLVRNAQASVLAKYSFSELVSTNPDDLKLKQIEEEVLASVQSDSQIQRFGVDIEMLGFKRIGLPESITANVFDRMKAERQREVSRLESEGESEAIRIRAEADRQRQQILADAQAQATVIVGQGEAEAAKYYKVFQKNPEFAIFLMEIETLEGSLKDRTTMILDQQTAPFHLLKQVIEDVPEQNGEEAVPVSEGQSVDNPVEP
jgi:membrane protease subunit HflC